MRLTTGPASTARWPSVRLRAERARGVWRDGIGVGGGRRHRAVPEIALVVVLQHRLAGKQHQPCGEAGDANANRDED